jgi:catechol 2,3-dioxygenase-like lactoylglutathione lyase family enzyme
MQLDHINIVVRDLKQMVDFYTRVLGLRETKRVTISGKWIDETVGLTDVLGDVVYLELESGPRIELIYYRRPTGVALRGLDQANTAGLRHIAFRVDDIDATVARLRENGTKFFSGIQQVPDTQVTYAGGVRKRLIYFHDPEGNLLELCEYKAGGDAGFSHR